MNILFSLLLLLGTMTSALAQIDPATPKKGRMVVRKEKAKKEAEQKAVDTLKKQKKL